MIHLRRQSAALTEAIDSSKNELSQLRKMPPSTPQHPSILGGSSDGSGNGENSSLDQHKRLIDDFSHHIKELEDKRARGIPIISLVDNMVKLAVGAVILKYIYKFRKFYLFLYLIYSIAIGYY